MTLAFTLCSVNYLAQAYTLGNSLKKTNPDIKFFIGLVDKLDTKEISDEILADFPMIEVDKINIEDFAGMCDRYDITELNTAVKPYYFDYFLKKFPEIKNFIYFDPDIIVYNELSDLTNNLEKYNIVVTPHITIPYNDDKWQSENDIVKTGVYNLGFIAIRRSDEGEKLVKWWMKKLEFGAKIDLCDGLFTDQHWIDHVPNLFNNILIHKHLGYNIAYWNLHERFISEVEGKWFVNGTIPIQFFHYSGYNPEKPEQVSKYQNRIQFEARPDLHKIFEIYKNQLLENHQNYFKNFRCDYIKPLKLKRFLRVRKIFKLPFEKLIDTLENG